jgi:hypothetical protein
VVSRIGGTLQLYPGRRRQVRRGHFH